MSGYNIQELETCFQQPAIQSNFIGLYKSLGMITAIASSPDRVEPSEWFEQLQLRHNESVSGNDSDAVKRFTDNLTGWWNHCLTMFDHGHMLELPETIALTKDKTANSALVEFSSGYLEGYDWLSKTWQAMLPASNTEGQRSLMVLNLILGRFVDEQAVAKAEPEIFSQLPDMAGCFKSLPSLISAVGMLGHDLASQHAADTVDQDPSGTYINKLKDIGRNDPCPCGSGKKFKKCCLH